MKKTYKILLFIQLMSLTIFSILIANTFTKNKILYKNTASISIMSNTDSASEHTIEEKIKILEKNAKENGITLTKVVWVSEKEINLFTNDLTLHNFLEIDPLTELSSQEYLSNKEETGLTTFDWVDNNENVRIYPLSGLYSLGLEGEYFIRSNQESSKRNFVQRMSTEADLIIQQSNYQPLSELQILKALFSQPILLAALAIISISLICSLIFLYIQSSKKIAVQVLNGYSKKQLVISLLSDSIKTLVFSILANGILSYLYLRLKLKSFVLYKPFLGAYLMGLSLVIAIIVGITIFWVWNFSRNNIIYESIKEKKKYGLLISISKIFQLVFLFLFPFLLFEAMTTIHTLHSFEKANLNWEGTQNIYSTSIQHITSSYMEKRPYEEKIKNFYTENMDVFSIIDVSNYDYLSSGNPLYEANTTSKIDELTSPYGRRITINPTYLQWNPIYDKDGNKVDKSNILFQENAYNLLIPEKLNKYTEEIKKKFYEDFVFTTYTIPHDIYEEDVQMMEPDFNIIYLKDKQSYLTNNSSIQEEKENIVTDPIVVVDTGKIDASQYYSWFTSSTFFKKADGKTGYETIYPLLAKSGVTDLVQIVTPIYQQRASEIQKNKEELSTFTLLILFLLLSCFLCFYCFTCSIFDKNKGKIIIQIYAGYSKNEVYIRLYSIWMMLDLLVILLSSLFFGFGTIATFLLLISIFAIEILLVGIIFQTRRNGYDFFATYK